MAGVFLLYAPEKGFFDTEEMKLLSEVAGDISFALEHIEKTERLDYLAYYDVLTGLPNRALFQDRANQLLHAARRRAGTKIALVVLDLERFRTVNDTFGRGAGDAVLKQVAERLSAGRLGPDHLSRIGGDTFAAVLGDLEKEQEVLHFVEKRIIDALHEPITVGGQELRVSAKAGVALFPADGADADALFRNAEAALKKAKLSGDRYLFYTPELNARAAERLSLENKLRRALEHGELALHYQPKIDLTTGRICGLEALMRWDDPDSGPVPPVKFIPVLEETGLILEAGRWALERAVADSGVWRAKGLPAPRISVNVSAIQLRQKDFVAMVGRAARGAADATGVLELEITESLIMQDVEANIEKLKAVRDMGIGVTIDDFGTGYSSLAYIGSLPIDTLKIDRVFILNLARNPRDVGIVTTIISLAHSLKLKVVAEGVETQEQAKLLRLFKCDEMQGYLFSPAIPAGQVEILLGEGRRLST
jgi:diguanylate cyclase (GGDEF)-like protein